jgi:hypothetical protein
LKANRNRFDLSAVASAKAERLGYCRTRQRRLVRLGFALDADSKHGKLVFNRTITLKDPWAKIEKRGN